MTFGRFAQVPRSIILSPSVSSVLSSKLIRRSSCSTKCAPGVSAGCPIAGSQTSERRSKKSRICGRAFGSSEITKICTLQMPGSSTMCRRVTSHLADHWAGKLASTIHEPSFATWETCTAFPTPPGNSFLESSCLVAGMAQNLAAFHLACRFAEMRARRGLRSDGNPKRPDFWRYQLVTRLAECYEEVLELRPTSTRGGPWCRFLAEALRKCERKNMTDDTVYTLWLKVTASRPGRVSLPR